MAGLKKRIQGSTLIETLIAMILLITIISITFLSVVNIKKSFNSDIRILAYLVACKTLDEDDSLNKEIVINYLSFNILKTWEQYDNNPFLLIINVTAVNTDSVILCKLKKIKRISPGILPVEYKKK